MEPVRAAGCDGGARLLTRAPGYLLDVDGDQVDIVRFERLVRAAGSQPPEQAAALLEEALSLWRGPAYAEFADEEFARADATRLEELRLAAGSDWDGALTASGTATPAYGADADRLVTHAAVLRGALGPGRFSAAIARGAALGDDGAVPFARTALSHVAD